MTFRFFSTVLYQEENKVTIEFAQFMERSIASSKHLASFIYV